jgi:nicotinamidase-related amidase
MEKFTAENSMLFVIDMQELQREEFHKKEWRRIENRISIVRNVMQKAGILTVHIFLESRLEPEDPFPFDPDISPYRSEDSEGYTVYPNPICKKCEPLAGEYMYQKNAHDAFSGSTKLQEFIDKKMKCKVNIFLTGVVLHDCMIKTARGSVNTGHRPIIIPQATSNKFHYCRDADSEIAWLAANAGDDIKWMHLNEMIKNIRSSIPV